MVITNNHLTFFVMNTNGDTLKLFGFFISSIKYHMIIRFFAIYRLILSTKNNFNPSYNISASIFHRRKV